MTAAAYSYGWTVSLTAAEHLSAATGAGTFITTFHPRQPVVMHETSGTLTHMHIHMLQSLLQRTFHAHKRRSEVAALLTMNCKIKDSCCVGYYIRLYIHTTVLGKVYGC